GGELAAGRGALGDDDDPRHARRGGRRHGPALRRAEDQMSALTRRLSFLPWLPIYVAVYFLFLYLPILLLPVFSFNDAATATFPLAGFTTKWYASLAGNSEMQGAAWNSLVVGVAVSILATTLGICAARAI